MLTVTKNREPVLKALFGKVRNAKLKNFEKLEFGIWITVFSKIIQKVY